MYYKQLTNKHGDNHIIISTINRWASLHEIELQELLEASTLLWEAFVSRNIEGVSQIPQNIIGKIFI